MWCQLYWKCTVITSPTQYYVELYSLFVDSSIYYIYRYLYVMPTLLIVYSNNLNPVLCGAVQFVCRQFCILYLQISVCDAKSTESVQQQPAQSSTVWSCTVCLSTILYIIFTDICMWCQLYWKCTVITSPTQYCVELYSLFVDSSIYYIYRYRYVMPTLLKVYSNSLPNPVLCGAVQFVCRQFYILYLQISVCDANSTESIQQQPAQPSTVWSYTVCVSTVLYNLFTDFCMWCQLYWKCTASTNQTQYCVELYSLFVDSSVYYICRFLYVMPTLLKVYSNNQPNPVLCGAIQFVCQQFYILYLQISICDANSTESVQ